MRLKNIESGGSAEFLFCDFPPLSLRLSGLGFHPGIRINILSRSAAGAVAELSGELFALSSRAEKSIIVRAVK